MYCHPPNIEKGTRDEKKGIKITYIHHMVKKTLIIIQSFPNFKLRVPLKAFGKKAKYFLFWLCEFLFCVFMLTWLESLTSSRFPIGFCYQKTCDNKWWFSKSLILFCFQTASNFVTVLFFLTTSHLLLFSTKSQRAKNVTQLFLPFQFQPFEIIDFLIFPALCFHIKRAKKFGSFFWKHWFNFSRNWCI